MSAIDIAGIRATTLLSSIVRQHLKLVRAGREWKAQCPFHDDRTPSFTVNDQKGFYHCFGCGAHGDVLDFVQTMQRVGLRGAAEIIAAGRFEAPSQRPASACKDSDTTADAIAIWNASHQITGTPAETYLRSRGLFCRIPETVRFARLRYGKRGPEHPCLVAAVTNLNDQITGIQRTYLNATGSGKATVPKPKLSLGRIRGGAIRLTPIAAEIILCEGLEDALTLQQEMGAAAWAATGADNMRSIELPLPVRSVIIGADRDAAGEASARAAGERLAREGREVRIIRPMPGFKDFNDELREIAL